MVRVLRNISIAFQRRFADEPDAISGLHEIVRKLASSVVPGTASEKESSLDYVTGGSAWLYALRRASGFLRKAVSMMRIRLGSLRRKLFGI